MYGEIMQKYSFENDAFIIKAPKDAAEIISEGQKNASLCWKLCKKSNQQGNHHIVYQKKEQF